jgi:hypothetical protein
MTDSTEDAVADFALQSRLRDEKLREDIQGWFDRECHWLAFGAGYSGNEEGSAVLCISGLDAIYELAKIIRGET